ncbi:TRAP transporter small permease [Egicoccus sp. AB-alg2]|uniref:TRAP transporter small permease n=1 Tax=Egicoccus sp. AB-alg2 TaxID=3242693 RepID=UPI00359EA9BD
MQRFVARFAGLTRVLHYVSGALIVGLMLLIVGNVLGRWLFSRPVRGTVELTEIAMVGIVFLGFAYAQVREDHIRVDLVYEKLGRRGRVVLGLFAAAVSFATVVVMAWRLYDYTGILAASRRTTSALAIPLYWVAWVAVVGLVIYAVGVVVTGVTRTRAPDDPDPAEGPVAIDLPDTDDER